MTANRRRHVVAKAQLDGLAFQYLEALPRT